ncbi:MAG TPA: hypothetical protein VLF88_00635 [Candidatus Babeliales bacterium]|nr:hypothetical protein [Candidatus Babeliales bacterium]
MANRDISNIGSKDVDPKPQQPADSENQESVGIVMTDIAGVYMLADVWEKVKEARREN